MSFYIAIVYHGESSVGVCPLIITSFFIMLVNHVFMADQQPCCPKVGGW